MLSLSSEQEHKILKFWQENKIFEKLREKNKGKEKWSFLDGPITANNPMGVHHAWGRTYKDLFQRYKAMKGFDQRFQNGFDCQGLWVEVEVEKQLGLKNKKDIENLVPNNREASIAKFVELCKQRVKKFSKVQTEQSIRLGQWMDWENSYYTMSDENNYAIWHFLKKCKEQGLIYKGRDIVPWCPRCETAISQHEILTGDYKEIEHDSIFFKAPVVGLENTYFLVWTTTPWTIPANVALGINSNYIYALWEDKKTKEKYIFLYKGENKRIPQRDGKPLKEWVVGNTGKDLEFEKEIKTSELLAFKYKGAFDDLEMVKKAREENPETFHSVVDVGEIVNDEEGTGILHIAPGAGDEDFKIGKEFKLSVISPIQDDASYKKGLGDLTGKNAKKNPEIILEKLKERNFLFKTHSYLHRYPVCWRCGEELVWKIADEWYISMEGLREKLMQIAKTIKWIPQFGLERELDWLKNMDDWLISKKNRYWGLALPIYECKNCGNFEVIGSKEELKQKAVEGWEEFEGHSPHRPFVDKVKIKCPVCGNVISRIADVGNPWLDAGIVPFSTLKYFSDKKYWQQWFPVDFVCESFPGQFKNWFYSLIVMSTVLEGVAPMKTIFGYATVVDEKGEEMHKSKGNTIWFDEAAEKMGADVMRWLYSKQNPIYNLRFGFGVADEIRRKLLNLINSYTFFKTYVKKEEIENIDLSKFSDSLLDKWIVSRFNNLAIKVNKYLDSYNSAKAVNEIEEFFFKDLSLWYIRRSRKKFKLEQGNEQREKAICTLYYVLVNLSKILAPIIPFFAESSYLELKKKDMPESVHLCDYPQGREDLIDNELEEKMKAVRDIVALCLAERKEKGIKVRQPLSKLVIDNQTIKEEELLGLVKDEVNVLEVEIGDSFVLDTEITPELRKQGQLREIIRTIQKMRKQAGLVREDIIDVYCGGEERFVNFLKKNKEEIKKEISIHDIFLKDNPPYLVKEEINFDKGKAWIGIKKLNK